MLIVEAAGRHVRHHDGVQRADVDPRLHGRGDAEEVNAVDQRKFVGDEDILEPSLAPRPVVAVRLATQLLRVEPERRELGVLGELRVVVIVGR